MATIDLIVLLIVLLSTCAASTRLWRRGLRRRRLLAGVWLAFYGLMLVMMMVAHSAEILYRTYAGSVTMEGAPWSYDFRVYSLHLLGAVLAWQGVTVLRAVLTASSTGRAFRAEVTRSVWITLAVVLPLIPIQAFFGALLAALSVVSLVVLAAARGEQVSDSLVVHPRRIPW